MNASTKVLQTRRAGLLLHPTSLPGPGPQGGIGAEAHRFIDFLSACGFSVWQMLPIGPADAAGSPYHSISTHAGNPALISLEALAERGWIDPRSAREADEGGGLTRRHCLDMARTYFNAKAGEDALTAFEQFRSAQADWLEDFALYCALHEELDKPWYEWPTSLKLREGAALREVAERLQPIIERIYFEQYLFELQWRALKQHAAECGILLFGDLPIFVSLDSTEVWAHRELFLLDDRGQPQTVAGVPPDYFSETGQRWGNPHYRWEAHENTHFAWWMLRLKTQLERFDLLRIDHFRGLEACWEIPVEADSAVDGCWVKAPGAEMLARIQASMGAVPLVAEDLGYITPEVYALRDQFQLPGMNVMQFAFDGSADNPYLPHNHRRHSVTYTATHDNDTTIGWYESLDDATRERVLAYLGYPSEHMPWPLIRAALRSVSTLTILPMQDVLGLGSETRMNTPGTVEGNWHWRFHWDQLPSDLEARMARLNGQYGRV